MADDYIPGFIEQQCPRLVEDIEFASALLTKRQRGMNAERAVCRYCGHTSSKSAVTTHERWHCPQRPGLHGAPATSPAGPSAPGPWVLACLGCGVLLQIPEPRPAAVCPACGSHLDGPAIAMVNRAIDVGRQQQAALGESVHAADQAIIVHLARCHDAAHAEIRMLVEVLAGATSTSVVIAGLIAAAWLAWRWWL